MFKDSLQIMFDEKRMREASKWNFIGDDIFHTGGVAIIFLQ